MLRHTPSKPWTLLAMTRWVCRFGSPVRVSQWSNAAAIAPADRDLRDTLTPDAGEQRVRLDQLQALVDGVAVRGRDPGLRCGISQCPQDADRLRHRQCQVEPGHRDRGPPPVLLRLDHARSRRPGRPSAGRLVA